MIWRLYCPLCCLCHYLLKGTSVHFIDERIKIIYVLTIIKEPSRENLAYLMVKNSTMDNLNRQLMSIAIIPRISNQNELVCASPAALIFQDVQKPLSFFFVHNCTF